MTEETRSLAQVAYEAYADFTGHRSLVTGSPLPDWTDLSDALRGAWGMAAEAVIREIHENDILPETLTAQSPDTDEIDSATDLEQDLITRGEEPVDGIDYKED